MRPRLQGPLRSPRGPGPFQLGAAPAEAWFHCFPSSFLPADIFKVNKVDTSCHNSRRLAASVPEIRESPAHTPACGLDTDLQTRQPLLLVSVVWMSELMTRFPELQLGVFFLSSFLAKHEGQGRWEGKIFVTSAPDTQGRLPKHQRSAAFVRPRPLLLMDAATDRKVEAVCGTICVCTLPTSF